MIGPHWGGGSQGSQPPDWFRFLLDVGSQWEDTSYAPVRLDGWGVKIGYACAARPSRNPWSRISKCSDHPLAGNKFGRSPVFRVI
jgi:hypothetical protein